MAEFRSRHHNDALLILFGRLPVAGRAKTRLAPQLGFDGAAALYRAFLLGLVDSSRSLPPMDLVLSIDSAADVPALEDLLEGEGLIDNAAPKVLAQSDGNLGDRIAEAVGIGHDAGYRRVAVIGTDHPTLPIKHRIDLVCEKSGRVCVGPTDDGGIWGISSSGPVDALLADVRWSTDTVFTDIEAASARAGQSLSLLPPWYDVDLPGDLERLNADPGLRELAPRTARALAVEADRSRSPRS